MEKKIIEHCSPTLAGIKCGNMFKYTDKTRSLEETMRLNDLLRPRGISVKILFSCSNRDLIMVYREDMISKRLSSPGVSELLSSIGYDCSSVPSCLTTLSNKMSAEGAIPPEVGIFLGYPLEDVKGFIEHRGRYSKTVGCWKVYGDEEDAVRLFRKYKKCKDIFVRKYEAGYSITKLAVHA